MARHNYVSFIGRLGRDPEHTVSTNGKALTKFSIAVDQGKDQETMWLNVVLWEELAARMSTMLYKGAEVLVSGKLAQRKYNKGQEVKTITEIIGSDCQLLSAKRDDVPTSAPTPSKE